MKKFIALACAAVLTVASAVTAFAQPSVSVSGVVTAVTTATDKDGKAVNATFGEVPAEYASAVAEVKTAEKLKELLGSDYTSTMQVVDVKNVTVPDGYSIPCNYHIQSNRCNSFYKSCSSSLQHNNKNLGKSRKQSR